MTYEYFNRLNFKLCNEKKKRFLLLGAKEAINFITFDWEDYKSIRK